MSKDNAYEVAAYVRELAERVEMLATEVAEAMMSVNPQRLKDRVAAAGDHMEGAAT